VALVALDEGPTMMTNIIEVAPGEVRIGMRVSVRFERWTEEITMPKFAPARANHDKEDHDPEFVNQR
jgi:uncharacterized OB-fold protein